MDNIPDVIFDFIIQQTTVPNQQYLRTTWTLMNGNIQGMLGDPSELLGNLLAGVDTSSTQVRISVAQLNREGFTLIFQDNRVDIVHRHSASTTTFAVFVIHGGIRRMRIVVPFHGFERSQQSAVHYAEAKQYESDDSDTVTFLTAGESGGEESLSSFRISSSLPTSQVRARFGSSASSSATPRSPVVSASTRLSNQRVTRSPIITASDLTAETELIIDSLPTSEPESKHSGESVELHVITKLQSWRDVSYATDNQLLDSQSEDTCSTSIFTKKQKIDHMGVYTSTSQNSSPSFSRSSISSPSDTGTEYPSLFAREMQGDDQWNADMEEFNTTMGGTDGSQDSDIPQLVEQQSDTDSDVPQAIDVNFEVAEFLARRDSLRDEFAELVRIGALAPGLLPSDLSPHSETEAMIEQVGGDLYHLLHQHHVGFNLIRYEDDIAVIARSENATYVQLFPIQPIQQELNRLETSGAFTRTQSELPSEEENDDLHEEDS
jgi:hypothetical protein